MKCKLCKLIEMRVMARNEKEVVYQCPKCKEIQTISIEEEEEQTKAHKKELKQYLKEQQKINGN